ncbi:pyridoxamine 5'-phosphate oxidase family protein [Psychromonas sp. MME2]|uniref:2Fe-2S iron-sulfur cluster-binding protein n=1 Tax=unclassified Psychromonas TaxID=2614957 RepID=UPI00339C46FF
MPSTKKSQFHDAEIAIQEKLGIAEMVSRSSEGFIRAAMPDQHREFFTNLPMVIIGLVDHDGYPWAMPLFDKPGFIQSPDKKTLNIATLPALTDLFKLNFTNNQKIGLVGIDSHTRRRNRMNGVIKNINPTGFSIVVEQSFGNCPQYIQKRELSWTKSHLRHLNISTLTLEKTLSPTSLALLESADTFFIASRTRFFSTDKRDGIDASHRGGKPGFIKVEGDTLYFPDFSGNRFFNTLGNIESDGRVGLFIPNYSTGETVFLTGEATIIWDESAAIEFEGAERIVSVKIRNSIYLDNFLPIQGVLKELSPSLFHTGIWQENRDVCLDQKAFIITQKIKESLDITSFYLTPVDNSVLKAYQPGQFLPISIKPNDANAPIFRSYTLSRAPANDTYRISVKRESNGLVSRILHDQLNTGDIIYAGQPAGKFTLNANDNPIVLLSMGVGITPMIAMLQGLIRDIKNGATPRSVWFIHGTKNPETHAFTNELTTLTKQHHWLHIHSVYSQPKSTDAAAGNDSTTGRINIELLKRILPFDLFDFYLCGSESFMRSLYTGLRITGVNKSNIFYEFFGEGSIEENNTPTLPIAKKSEIHFSSSNITAIWTPEEGSLLEFAEKQGIKPMYSCRTGNCGACRCHIEKGKVSYTKTLGYIPEEGQVLLCCARPADTLPSITLDL